MDPELITIRPSDMKFVCLLIQKAYLRQYISVGHTYTVTMQALNTVPPEMQCKDKFLIQSMVVPFGSSEKDISSGIFTKGSGRYIQENKMQVLLVSPHHSPALLPINGALKPETMAYEVPVFQGYSKQEPAHPELISVKGNMKQEPEVDKSPVLKENMNEHSVSFSTTHQQNDVLRVISSPLLSELGF